MKNRKITPDSVAAWNGMECTGSRLKDPPMPWFVPIAEGRYTKGAVCARWDSMTSHQKENTNTRSALNSIMMTTTLVWQGTIVCLLAKGSLTGSLQQNESNVETRIILSLCPHGFPIDE